MSERHKVSTRTYRWLHATLGRLIMWFFPVRVKGRVNIPSGPAIFVSGHKAVIDSYVIVASLDRSRSVKIPAKAEYFIENGNIKERIIHWLVKQVGVRVDRDDRASGQEALQAMIEEIADKGSLVIHPEGTRTPGTSVYKAKTGFVQVAWETGVPVVPVALRGTAIANEPGKRRLRRHTIEVEFLPAVDRQPSRAMRAVEKIPESKRTDLIRKEIARLRKHTLEHQAREIMELLAASQGVRYVNEDSRELQKRLDLY